MNDINVSATEDMPRAAGRSEAPGKVLAEARQAQNLSVADVARQLKLSVHQVEALEAGAFERLPGSVFVRGFIRNYARFLKLDAESLLRSVAECLPREEPRPAAPPSQEIPFPTGAPRRWPAYAALALVVVAALAAYEFFLSEPQTVGTPVAVPSPPTAQPLQPGALEAPQPGAVPAVDAGQAVPRAEQPGAVAPATVQGEAPGAAGRTPGAHGIRP
jgi:cytoskeleton protein RodZ